MLRTLDVHGFPKVVGYTECNRQVKMQTTRRLWSRPLASHVVPVCLQRHAGHWVYACEKRQSLESANRYTHSTTKCTTWEGLSLRSPSLMDLLKLDVCRCAGQFLRRTGLIASNPHSPKTVKRSESCCWKKMGTREERQTASAACITRTVAFFWSLPRFADFCNGLTLPLFKIHFVRPYTMMGAMRKKQRASVTWFSMEAP